MGRIGNVSSGVHRETAGGGVRASCIRKEDAADKPKRSEFGKRPLRTAKKRQKLVTSECPPEEFESVWEALGFPPLQAANLHVRSALMMQIETIIEQSGWSQAEAAKRCGVSQPRVNDLLRGRMDRFSIDALVKMAAALGQRVNFKLEAA